MPFASIIVTCKGRLEHLREVMPTLLNQQTDLDYEVIVVDYGDPDNSFTWCQSLAVPRVRAVRVLTNTDAFNLSRARNCGATHALGQLLAMVDADTRLGPLWLATSAARQTEGPCALIRTPTPGCLTSGICMVTSDVFHAVRGYDESLSGWGYEDSDFYRRCKRHGPVITLDWGLAIPIPHDDALRVQYYEEKDLDKSQQQNHQSGRSRHRRVNADGYGAAPCDTWP